MTSQWFTVRVPVPEWTDEMREQLAAEAIVSERESDRTSTSEATEVSLKVQATDERDARIKIAQTLRPLVALDQSDLGPVDGPSATP